MEKDKINILIEGNTISNVDELIKYINTLEYNFNVDEYLKSLYIRLLYSNYVNKTSLLKCIKNKIDEFANINNENNIRFNLDNNKIDDNLISYMDMMLDSMPYRLEHNLVMEQKLLDDYIGYLNRIDNVTTKELEQINKYQKIKEQYYIKNKKLELRKKSSLGATSIVILLELMMLMFFIYLYMKI